MKQLSLLEQARLRAPEKDDPEHVAQLAADIIRDLAEEPPIDLDVIAGYCGIHEIRLEEMDHSGSLTPQGGRFVMRLRRSESWTRQRFTGFHEVGHTFLPGYAHRAVFRCGPSYQARRPQRAYSTETLADVAASEFLLPKGFVASDLAAGSFGIETVTSLAERYDAGIHASANRFVQLWPEPALLVVLEPCNKPRDAGGAEPKLRVQASWAQPVDSWPRVHKWKSTCDEGALRRAFAGEFVTGPASLDELGLEDPAPLEISARPFAYRASGELHQRVFALYRRRSRLPLRSKGRHG
jgi:hypothetical protein